MKLIDDDGTEIQISEETARNIRDARKPKGREKQFDYVRVSEADMVSKNFSWPIRISILDDRKEGYSMGEGFDGWNAGKIPGNTLDKEKARDLANYILELCNGLEKK